MRRLRPSLRRLRWKLTLSYTFVTVGALVALELLVLTVGVGVAFTMANRIPGAVAEEMTHEVAPRLRPYLSGESPDVEGIHRWLQRVERVGLTSEAGTTSMDLAPEEFTEGHARLFVLDTGRRVLGTTGQTSAPTSPAEMDASAVPGLGEVLQAALSGSPDVERLYQRSESGRLTIAAPIRDAEGEVLGALVLSNRFAPLGGALRPLATILGVSVLLFTVAAGIIGAIFGFFTAKGLTRRLNGVTTAAAAWGAGDFSQVIRDTSGDEIGEMSRQLNRMAAQLEELIKTRQQLSIVDERNRLARDLHDSVKQQVFAISMHLSAAQAIWEKDRPSARDRLDTAVELARQSRQELTTIIQMLRPVQLEGKGVREALREYVKQWQDQSRITAKYEVIGDGTVPFPAEEALYRIAQEALANVARHSRATCVWITLATLPDKLELEIRDNGDGFDPKKQGEGVGLHSMQERIEAVGGHLRLDSSDAGTSIVAQVPLVSGERES